MLYKSLVTVKEVGKCGHGHKVGENFEIDGTTTNGKPCLEAATNLYWQAAALTGGANLPWAKGSDKSIVYTHCPDPNGVVFEVKRIPKK